MSMFFIARDGNGDLFFYAGKPRLSKGKKIWQPAAVQNGGYVTGGQVISETE